MRPSHSSSRQSQALREAGRTEIRRGLSVALTLGFLATVASVPLLQAIADSRSADGPVLWPRVRALAAELHSTRSSPGPLQANRRAREALERFEDRVEDESILRRHVLPPTQKLLTAALGVGNEQAYLGRDGWLFFREDFEHVTGAGFLDPAQQRKAELSSERAADPLPAIVDLERQLRERGIALLVLPTPVKPMIHPERFRSAADARQPIRNVSFPTFLARLREAGVAVFDPTGLLMEAKSRDEQALYLRADTHWTPRAMDLVARSLAEEVDRSVEWRAEPDSYRRRAATVEGSGDIAQMLRPPSGRLDLKLERAEIAPVMASNGRGWRSNPEAELLLLGDSFTNVFSDPSLGWGAGAGLAEQLSFHLQRPLDRIAVNAGGALRSREALSRALAQNPARLNRKRIVIYQFATRELSTGDWKPLAFPARP